MKRRVLQTRNTIILVFAIISAFIFFILLTVLTYNPVGENFSGFWKLLIDYHLVLMVLTEVMGLAAGAAIYYTMSKEVELSEKSARKSSQVFMQFLSNEEQKAVNFLLKHEGTSLQSKLSRAPGMNRLKSHRVVSRLAEKGVILVEENGKTKSLTLQKEIYDSLTDE